jgi:protein TonB
LAIGLGAALLLHGGVLALLILKSPDGLQPAPQSAGVSLLLTQPVAPSVAARPPTVPAIPPAAATSRITNAPPRPQVMPKPLPALTSHPVLRLPRSSASAPAVASTPAPIPAPGNTAAAPGSQRFTAALPLPGNVNPPPAYPAEAIAHGEQGEVLLSIHVLPTGRPDFVAVTQSSGYRILDQAAADAVMAWRFRPASLGGKAVPQVIPYLIRFDLQGQSALSPASASGN